MYFFNPSKTFQKCVYYPGSSDVFNMFYDPFSWKEYLAFPLAVSHLTIAGLENITAILPLHYIIAIMSPMNRI